MLSVTEPEYALLKKFIEDHCGIFLEKGKEYLIETRLSELASEVGANSFQEFHYIARTDPTGTLRDRIIDAMTTNETSWFRDSSAWKYIQEIAVPSLMNRVAAGEKIRVWSAASSTGQEPYSFAMLISEEAMKRGMTNMLNRIEILGSDISVSAINAAKKASFDAIAISRGLPQDKKLAYFKQEGNFWLLKQEIKKMVQFQIFNLQNNFSLLGIFDLILCRYVTIYFSEKFKRELFMKFSKALKRSGDVLILGATESLRGFSNEFEVEYYKNAMINKKV